MTVTFEAMTTSTFGPKALYSVLVDGVKVGVVSHERKEMVRRHVRFPRDPAVPAVHYSRRSRPLVWVARGTSGRKMVQVVRTSRQAAVQGLLEGLGIESSTQVDENR